MAYAITEACISCNACKLVCPQKAIVVTDNHYSIAAHRCDECKSHFPDAQCSSICPVEMAIVDSNQLAINPKGSLSPSSAVSAQIKSLTRTLI